MSPPLPPISGAEAIKALKKVGFEEVSEGDAARHGHLHWAKVETWYVAAYVIAR